MTDRSKRDAFSRKMTEILNHGAVNLAMAIGYRTGLFDAMDRLDVPRSAAAVAEAAGLAERYVREWLGVMVAGGIVELLPDPTAEDRFFLPRAHADLVTRRAGNANLGVYTQEIPLLTTSALDPVVRGFTTGEGVSYEHYPGFQSFMTELSDAKHRRVLVDRFLPSVDDGRLVTRLETGISVCDLGCAEGVAVLLMAEAFPRSRFTGIDISETVIEIAREIAVRRGIRNATFVQADAAALAESGAFAEAFDYVTAFDAIHDQTRPADALTGVRHILKPGGAFSMIDIAAESSLAENLDHPMAPFLYTVSLMHCMPVGLADGGAGLGMMWGRQQAVSMLHTAGFTDVDVQPIPDDPFNLHFFCRKAAPDDG